MAHDNATHAHGEDSVQRAAAFIRQRTAVVPQLGIVLGSGLGALAEQVQDPICLRYADIPGSPVPGVPGHPGELVIGTLGQTPVVMLRGRVHAYEGHSQAAVTFHVRLVAALGAKRLLVTNAAGGLNPHFVAGDVMVICDHLNMTGQSPLIGINDDALGPRFVDMTEAYARSGRQALAKAAAEVKTSVRFGTYVGVMGPAYETPSEVRAYRMWGGDAVGMSTVNEVIAARHRGLEVAGLSVITNMGAGLSHGHLSHDEVTEVAREVRGRVSELVVAACRAWMT